MAGYGKFDKFYEEFGKECGFKNNEAQCQTCYETRLISDMKKDKAILKCMDCYQAYICGSCFEQDYLDITENITNEELKKTIKTNMRKYYKCRTCIYVRVEDAMYPDERCTDLELFKVKNFIHGFLYTAVFKPENLYKNCFCKHVRSVVKEQKEDYKPIDFLTYDPEFKWYENECIYCNLSMMLFGGFYNLKFKDEDVDKEALLHYGSLLDDIMNYNNKPN